MADNLKLLILELVVSDETHIGSKQIVLKDIFIDTRLVAFSAVLMAFSRRFNQ